VGVTERRERERAQLRSQIIDATVELLLEQGLAGVSMRAIAERVEYSPATIYLYFEDKDSLLREVVRTGFARLGEVMCDGMMELGEAPSAAEQCVALGRSYARFAVANPAYFRVMFELPGTAQLDGDESCTGAVGLAAVLPLVQEALAGAPGVDPRRSALVGWGLIHGLTTLYLAGHLSEDAATPAEFLELIEIAMQTLNGGWGPHAAGGEAV
jgi:AcrR family transcriptional regulator